MRKVAVPLAVIAASTAIALLAFEILLRAIGYSAPVFRAPHPTLGWSLRAGAQGWWTGEGRSYVRINAAGQRDRERALEKPAGVYRVAVLGDSYSEAMHVDQEKTYWSLLEKKLAQCKGRDVEVLNFGVAGYGTAQQLMVLESTALRYKPDLVLLQFTNGNDVSNNSKALERDRERPFYVLENGKLRLDNAFQSDKTFRDRSSFKSTLVRDMSDHWRTLQMVRTVANAGLFSGAVAKANEIEAGLDMAPLAPPRSAQWEEAWRVTERLVEEIRDLSSKNRAGFALVMVPYAIQAHPDARLRASVQEKLEVNDLFYPERRLESFSKRNGIELIALAPAMQKIAEGEKRLLYGFENAKPGFGHWNEDGHRVAAGLIARRLCAE